MVERTWATVSPSIRWRCDNAASASVRPSCRTNPQSRAQIAPHLTQLTTACSTRSGADADAAWPGVRWSGAPHRLPHSRRRGPGTARTVRSTCGRSSTRTAFREVKPRSAWAGSARAIHGHRRAARKWVDRGWVGGARPGPGRKRLALRRSESTTRIRVRAVTLDVACERRGKEAVPHRSRRWRGTVREEVGTPNWRMWPSSQHRSPHGSARASPCRIPWWRCCRQPWRRPPGGHRCATWRRRPSRW